MPPFDTQPTPVALPGEAVRDAPTGDVYRVIAIEQMAKIGPVDYGPASAQDTATEDGSSIIDLGDELEMDDDSIGQYYVNPLSNVEIEIRQFGQQDQRFVNANQVGQITMNTPLNQRQVFVSGDRAPHAIINNPTQWDYAKTLVYYTGFKLNLDPNPLRPNDLDVLPGSPATIPTDSIRGVTPAVMNL